ncbi:fatty acid desaturase [Aestuariivirga sp.]|uniref:fatty acid desaturase n=1 Tax=Aestuariivirga sp. TaxID=2650926 RepID=UPI003BA8A0FC
MTAGLFIACWCAMLLLSWHSWWLPLLLAVPTAAFLVRLFIIQHDCGHGAMFSSRRANDWTGRVLGVITLTPYDMWRYSHARHHAGSGHLDKRGIGDISTLTVREYLNLSPLKRFGYRIYRHPLVMFGIGPAYLFLGQHRLPVGAMKAGLMPWVSTGGTNAGILVASALLIWGLGWMSFLAVHLPVMLLGASIGVWLFYVQHQFEDTSWEQDEGWSQASAAVHGSSFYELPRPLMWITGNIGIHHLHHLSSRIPFYRLSQALDACPELKAVGRLTLKESLGCVRLTLWDEGKKRLVPFSEVRPRSRDVSSATEEEPHHLA